jgi:hypothetical protein
MAELTFPKTGREIKAAIEQRRAQLRQRLERRNAALDRFMEDRTKLRSYLLRSTQPDFGMHGRGSYILVGEDDISSEEKQEIQRLCMRIFEIEQELHRLALVAAHLGDEQVVALSFNDLVAYGFDTTRSLE